MRKIINTNRRKSFVWYELIDNCSNTIRTPFAAEKKTRESWYIVAALSMAH
jgi:hypothetical protein